MPMIASLALLLQVAAPAPAPAVAKPTLAFPEAGLDDPATYQGYQTRFFRDGARNTLQIYIDERAARVVHLWADAENESIGFTARRPDGSTAPLRWDGDRATLTGSATSRRRTVDYQLRADGGTLSLGWFLLGSMRVERDFQYEQWQRKPFSSPAFHLLEIDRLAAALGTLDAGTRRQHLESLNAPDLATLNARRSPTSSGQSNAGWWAARVVQPSLDGRDTLTLEIRVRRALVDAAWQGDSLVLRARSGNEIPFTVSISTTGAPLTPLARRDIFSPAFLAFLARTRAEAPDSTSDAGLRARRLERQVRGVELLSSREKLMAGLPTYATYFGRDMLMSALMMRSIWQPAMSEAVIAAALRKLSPAGEVSHEEALGGQAVREAAAEYATLIDSSRSARARAATSTADSLREVARSVLQHARRTRENYHMIDDEFQLPVFVARWITDSTITPASKRAFLRANGGGASRAVLLLRELALVARMTAAYVAQPSTSSLISFAPRDVIGWASQSWRDSGVGYASGRYAMDVNAIWAPQALEAIARILPAMRALGEPLDALVAADSTLSRNAVFVSWVRQPSLVDAAARVWRGADQHFLVQLSPTQLRNGIDARLAAMPAAEQTYWRARVAATGSDKDSLTFLALSLDAAGQPIRVANTDPATRLFLGEREGQAASFQARDIAAGLRDAQLFARPYPAGLLVDGVGPAVSNDAYATPAVWDAFVKDAYHGPRVVWGREVNLFLLAAAERVRLGERAQSPEARAYAKSLREAIVAVTRAVDASGFHSELWSYDFSSGMPGPIRYGSGADVQLWSTTDLAVAFALSRIAQPR